MLIVIEFGAYDTHTWGTDVLLVANSYFHKKMVSRKKRYGKVKKTLSTSKFLFIKNYNTRDIILYGNNYCLFKKNVL